MNLKGSEYGNGLIWGNTLAFSLRQPQWSWSLQLVLGPKFEPMISHIWSKCTNHLVTAKSSVKRVGLITGACSISETVWPIQGELVPLRILDTENHKFLCDMDVMTRPLPPPKEDPQPRWNTVTYTQHVREHIFIHINILRKGNDSDNKPSTTT
jgi:hypothetical protein